MDKSYPAHQGYRGGCKVGWLIYNSRADAEKAAKAARSKARELAAQGYDFGYQMPGSIEKTDEGYEVCIP